MAADHSDHLKQAHPELYEVVKVAQAQVGKPYVWGTEGPRTFDCSGLIHYVYLRVGLRFARVTAAMLARVGEPVYGRLHPGDILVVNGGSHVVLYVGDGAVIHAPHSGDVVRYAPVSRYRGRVSAVRRLIPWRRHR